MICLGNIHISRGGYYMKYIEWIDNPYKESNVATEALHHFSEEEMNKAMNFHSDMPNYEATPLHRLTNLSDQLGVKGIYVKDESKRFGLNAFKGLGGSYAIASYFAKELSLDLRITRFQELVDQVASLPAVTFATVTAGNHGRGVAWAAYHFNQKAKVYMPKGSSPSRLEAIKKFGAEAYMSDVNYDDTVQQVAQLAAEQNWVLLQDTAWEGYEAIPLYIMQGYTTILAEIVEQLKEESLDSITHIFLQAGVGSFAASIAAAFYNLTSESSPKIVIVEPSKADCLYQSALHASGDPQRVYGKLDTMMAGLACGEPSPVAWDILKSISDCFISVDDTISAKGMQLLGHPRGEDAKVISGESGAVPLGVLYELLTNDQTSPLKEELGLDESSNILFISTEGDTDPDNYQKIVGGH